MRQLTTIDCMPLTAPIAVRTQGPDRGPGTAPGTRRAGHGPARAARGFTLIELMITLTVAGILGVVAAPAMSVFLKNSGLRGTAYELMGALTLARGEAIKRGTRAVLCQRAEEQENAPAAAPACGGNDWSNGWLVFLDENNDRTFDPDDGDILLDTGSALAHGIQLRTNTQAGQALTYLPSGAAQITSAAHFVLCDERQESHGRQVNVSLVGRPVLVDGTRNPLDACEPAAS